MFGVNRLANSAGKQPRTLAWYRDVVDLHLVPALGGRPFGSITPLDVQQLVNDLGARFAPTTTRGYYAALRAVLNGALNADLIGRSPCRGIKLPNGRAKVRRIAGPTEVQKLADAIGDGYRAMALLAAELGLRWANAPACRSRTSRCCAEPSRFAATWVR